MLRRSFLSLAIASTAAPRALAQVDQGPPNVPEFRPAFPNQTRAPALRDRVAFQVTRVVGNLENPWGIAVLPDGGYLVTERVGRVNHIAADGSVTRLRGVPDAMIQGQGGMLDVAVDTDFAETRRVFLTYAKRLRGSASGTAAGWGILSDDNSRLNDFRDIFIQSPPVKSGAHFGSRVVPDGRNVFVTIGDRGSPRLAQVMTTTIGKTVRVTIDATIPNDNPYAGQSGVKSEIWSHGHRNPQGATLHPRTGELWTLEHGPKGGDELNRVRPGRNYGWPLVSYGENYNGSPVGRGRTSGNGISEPVYYWDPVIAPGGVMFYTGSLLKGWDGDVVCAALGGRGIVRLKLNGDRVVGEARYLQDMGRVRDVDQDRDGALLVLTDDPAGGVFRVVPR